MRVATCSHSTTRRIRCAAGKHGSHGLSTPFWRYGAVTLLAALFVAVPIWSLLGPGVFGWHVQQPAAWQGGLEAGAVFLLLLAGLRLCTGWRRWLLIGTAAALYARHHGVDVAILVTWLYMEGIFALGGLLRAALGLGSGNDARSALVAGLVGLVAWSLILWLASLFGVGSMKELALLACLVLLPALLLRGPRMGRMLLQGWAAAPAGTAAFSALIGTLLLVLFAKASVTSDFDSNWYGLAADRVLVASGNVFRSEALVAPVHYYPKLIELLQVPLAAVWSIPAIVGLSIGCWVLVLCTASQILRELGVRPALRLATVALVATLPALANVSITAKGDAMAAWLAAMALWTALRYRRGKGAHWFWLAAAAALLASQARLSNVPYAVAASLITLVIAAARCRSTGLAELNALATSRGIVVFAAALAVTALITLRTYLLTGLPLIAPNQAVALFQQWGMQLKAPVGLLPSSDLLVYLPPVKTAITYLFDPRQYPLLQIFWTGNVWLFLPLAALLLGIAAGTRWGRAWPVAAMGLLFFPMLLGNRFIEASGADGNYFITPIVCSILFAGFVVQQALRGRGNGARRLILVILFAFASSSALICLVTGSWGPGTRPFDVTLDRNPMDTRQRRAEAWAATGMEGIARILARLPADTRAIGDVGGEGFWLPVRYEPLDIIALTRKSETPSTEATLAFMERTGVEYVIVRTPVAGAFAQDQRALSEYGPLMLRTVLAQLGHQGRCHLLYMDDKYELWKVEPGRARPAGSPYARGAAG